MKIYCLLLCCLATFSAADNVYRYQDEAGKWHFTDKKPQQAATQLHFRPQAKKIVPYSNVKHIDNNWCLVIVNPLVAPIEVAVTLNDKTLTQVINAQSEAIISRQADPQQQYLFRYVIGSTHSQPDGQAYLLPVKRNYQIYISQAFNGRFSHQQQPATYAVDIAMPVGTEVLAARSGKVVEVEDSFVLDGTNEYFLDKANVVKVLHDDGTLGIYAHLLASGAKVHVGQEVQAGDVLALSGSTGFSSGPHMHFVVWQNIGMHYRSIPFHFKEAHKAGSWQPATGLLLEPD